ncbi:caspase family protein [Micromonospora sp. Llam7]|uniref:caspase family protein n=1 Tax=Micromonospora tarapacensis TaxID=2835305 RepID=UPI001C83614B|nr:caspase family protein [Micromonospora tarapacensis]MBX7267846.1 caspase family protein [Micromonospora tarapacensis]
MSARLPDPPTSRALLIGASRFTSADLHDLPAVVNNVQALTDVLTDPVHGGLDRSSCQVLTDPATQQQVGDAPAAAVDEALDTLVLYYAGHRVLNQRGHLFLAVETTNPDPRRVHYCGVPMEWLRSALADSPARNRILILDCCFSGHAAEAMSDTATAVNGKVNIHGTYTLASAPAHETAVAPVGAQFTAFTGELLNALRQGVPGGGPLLTLNDIYPALSQALLARGMPHPQRLGTGLADHIALTHNRAYRHPTRSSATPRPVREQRRSPSVPPRASEGHDPQVAAEFHTAMLDGYRRAKRELNYNAGYFLQMVQEVGGVEAARPRRGGGRASGPVRRAVHRGGMRHRPQPVGRVRVLTGSDLGDLDHLVAVVVDHLHGDLP